MHICTMTQNVKHLFVVSITDAGSAIQSKLYGLSKSKRDFTEEILLLKESLEMFSQSQCHVYTRGSKLASRIHYYVAYGGG